MSEDLAQIAATVAERTQAVEERKALQKKARFAKARAKKIKAAQELQEKLVAPTLLLITIVVSIVVLWFSRGL